jgi:hypothetical protein
MNSEEQRDDFFRGTTTCVVEPIMFQHSLFVCQGWVDHPLTLRDVVNLSLLAEACVIHDWVVVPDPSIPRFRVKPDYSLLDWQNPLKSPFIQSLHPVRDRDELDDRLQYILRTMISESEYAAFVDMDHRVSDAPHTDSYESYMKEFEERQSRFHTEEEKARKEATRRGERFIDLTNIPVPPNPDVLAYFDKIAGLAERWESTLVLPPEEESRIVAQHAACAEEVTKALVSYYEKKKREELEKGIILKHKRLSCSAPYFLDAALRQVERDNRRALLKAIADLHNYVAPDFRELGRALKTAPEPRRIELTREIESLFDNLMKGVRVPQPYVRLLLEVVSLIPVFVGFKWEDLAKKAKDIYELVTGRDYSRLHRGIGIMNLIHIESGDIDSFYHELKRVFVDLEFSREELQVALLGRKSA